MISNRWKLALAALPIIGTLALAQPQPGGLAGFFSAWWGVTAADPYERLLPTAYWYPSADLSNADRILGIASTNTVNAASTTANGWEFNGTSQYLDMGRPPEIEVGTNLNYTMSYWVKFSATSNGAGIMGKTFVGGGDRWSLHLDGNAPVGPVVLLAGATIASAKQNTTPTIGVWYHYVGVFERVTSGGIKLYVDGVQVASATYSNTDDITYDGNQNFPFQFGRFGSVAYLNGYLDRAAVWNGRALTSNEVFNLFEQTKAGRK